MITRTTFRLLPTFVLVVAASSPTTFMPQAAVSRAEVFQKDDSAKALPDLSGLAWIEGDTFLAVHDSKNPDEIERPRISLLWLPDATRAVRWKHIELDWPRPFGPSGDLESIARIPGTNRFLLIESGEGSLAGRQLRRIFLIEAQGERLKLLSFINMPAGTRNIEGAAVARAGARFALVFAERAEGEASTLIAWADLELEPLRLGAVKEARFRAAGFAGRFIRPVSAIETDAQGRFYIASAYDPGDDNGPFKSVIWKAGQIRFNRRVGFSVRLDATPTLLARLDGFKVESLAIREQAQGKVELFAGMDDENYGGTLRLISIKPKQQP